ncbi:uncharacterized protein [Diadema setosum]|uniref:uncharacterized protein n=1 Tax=Diadema setosum TaxID=31175 RepID=UPI003B3A1A1A
MSSSSNANTRFPLTVDGAPSRSQPPQCMASTGASYTPSVSLVGDSVFDYQKEMESLERLSSQLDSVKQQLMADILRCQLLQVDLATQFDPKLVQQLRATKLSCEKCEATLTDSVTADGTP